MENLVDILRGDGAVSPDDARAVIEVLAPIVESTHDEQAVDAVRGVITRLEPTGLLPALLDWWYVVATGQSSPVGRAHRLGDELHGPLGDALDALVRVSAPAPAAEWLQRRRTYDQRLAELGDRMDLEFYGKSKLPPESSNLHDAPDTDAGQSSDPTDEASDGHEKGVTNSIAQREASRKGTGVRWTRPEEARLVEGFRGGLPLPELARRHGRSVRAIEQRLAALGVNVAPPSGSGRRRRQRDAQPRSSGGGRHSASSTGTGVRSFGLEPAIGERCSACEAWVPMGAAHDCK